MANSLHRAHDLDIIAPSGSTKVMVVTDDEFQFAYSTLDAIHTSLDKITLLPQNPLPSATTGSLAVSGSSLYFYNGTAWKAVTLAS
jgi:hypothetical protein